MPPYFSPSDISRPAVRRWECLLAAAGGLPNAGDGTHCTDLGTELKRLLALWADLICLDANEVRPEQLAVLAKRIAMFCKSSVATMSCTTIICCKAVSCLPNSVY